MDGVIFLLIIIAILLMGIFVFLICVSASIESMIINIKYEINKLTDRDWHL